MTNLFSICFAASVVRSLDAVPSMPFCTLKHASSSMNGTGELITGGEIYRLLPRSTAKNVLPLLAKTSMSIRFPVQFLGSTCMELWGKSSSKSFLANFREIALADFDGKTLGAHQRRSIFQDVRVLAGKSQIGSGVRNAFRGYHRGFQCGHQKDRNTGAAGI